MSLFRVAKLTLQGLKRQVLLGNFVGNGSQKAWKRGMNRVSIAFVVLVKVADMLWQFRARFKVVAAAHHQKMRSDIMRLEFICLGIEAVNRLVDVRGRPIGDVSITIIEVRQQNAGTVGGFPCEQRGRAIRHAAPQAGGVHVETVEDLGKLRKMPKGVGNIADHHALTKKPADVLSN